ncbi:cupin 2 domain-containing protein [Sphingomonas sp. BE123]|uniref:cupin domain-containing protein n=1 Tax=unclassified Sphingomonas TaxID=196159 RepID=UPI0028593535|nr:cupin domain-containing protein [Sphingomonas sp. BE123]MDR6851615.1 cupin 2 domain-containing protein [Sphingomonas sp. BE123]
MAENGGNIFAPLPDAREAEVFTPLLERSGVRIERIVSHGQATPEDAPFVQGADEWVVVLRGSAGLRIEGRAEVALVPGDHVFIPGGARHWVTWTDPDAPTLWLAVHLS